MTLAGKTALVTGASRGIGRAIALRLAAQGARVAVHYHRAAEEAEQVVGTIAAAGGKAFALRADLGDRQGPAVLVAALQAALTAGGHDGRLDILVNNAGIGGAHAIGETSLDDFDRMIAVNLRAPYFLIQALIPVMVDHGRIINLSSMGTRAAYPAMSVYAPAKAGLEALTRILAVELGHRGITVNAVAPGATATDMNPRATNPDTAAQIAQTVALGRVGRPDDIACVVSLLASPDSAWITGQTIDASGGQRL